MVRQFLLFEVYKFSYQCSYLKQLSGPIEGKRGEIAVFTPVTRSSRSSKLPSDAIPYSGYRFGQHPETPFQSTMFQDVELTYRQSM